MNFNKLLAGIFLIVGWILLNPYLTVAAETAPNIAISNIDKLIASIKEWQEWIPIILITIGAGILGGLAHKITAPSEDKISWSGYIVVGAIAALAALFVLTPEDGVKLIALSLAAGYGGKAVLDAMEARVKTALAQAETAKAKEETKKAVKAGKVSNDTAQRLGRHISLQSNNVISLQNFTTSFSSEFGKSIDDVMEDLKRLEYKLDSAEESLNK